MSNTKRADRSDINDPRVLANAFMIATLKKACNGGIRLSEAEAVNLMMQAYEHWSNASHRDELVENSRKILTLGNELKTRKAQIPDDLLERTKEAVRNAVTSAMRETMTAEFAKANAGSRRKAPARK